MSDNKPVRPLFDEPYIRKSTVEAQLEQVRRDTWDKAIEMLKESRMKYGIDKTNLINDFEAARDTPSEESK